MKFSTFFLIAAFLLTACAGGGVDTASGIRTYSSVNTYKLRGKTVEAMESYISRHGVLNGRGQRSWATVGMEMSWNRNCEVQLDFKFTFPEWIHEKFATVDFREKWHRFYEKLVEHEQGHVAIWLANVETFKERGCTDFAAMRRKAEREHRFYDELPETRAIQTILYN